MIYKVTTTQRLSRARFTMVNLRESRFAKDTLPYDNSKQGWSLATYTGKLGEHIELNRAGEVTFELHTDKRGGLWVDDMIAFSAKWLRSLKAPLDAHQVKALTALEVALFVLDDRAAKRHQYSESAEEAGSVPDRTSLPTEHEWLAILHSLRESTPSS